MIELILLSLHCAVLIFSEFAVSQRFAFLQMSRQFVIVGRPKPTEKNPNPEVFRMKLFAKNPVVARSRFWYFLGLLKKIKRASGEIVECHEVRCVVNEFVCLLSVLALSYLRATLKRHLRVCVTVSCSRKT